MAESPSSNPTSTEPVEGAVAGRVDGVATAPEIVLTEDGVPVADLREAADQGGALVLVDGVLTLRLADGTEWPIDVTVAEGDVVLQVADQGYVAASAIEAALSGSDSVLPLTDLGVATDQAGIPANDADETVEPAAADALPAHGGGAGFRAFEIGDIGDGLDPLLALGLTDPDSAGGIGNALQDPLDDLGATGPSGGSRFVNFAPVANDDDATTDERQSIDINVLANDRDPNPKDDVRIVGIEAEGLSGIVTLNEDGTINYDPNGEFTHLGVGEQATETFRYTVVDQFGETDTATVTVQITGLNDAPEATDDAAETTEKRAVAIDVLANDVDPDVNDELAVVAVEVTNLVGDLQFLGDGTFLYDPAGRFDALGKDQTATDTFRYAISDPHGETAIASVEILINGVNDAPVANDDIAVVDEKGLVRVDALANDFDPDIGDTIQVVNLFSLGGSQGHRWINHDGTVSYRPAGAYDYLGEGEFAIQEFGYTISDQHGATDTATISVLVTGVNDAPVANDDHATTDEKSTVALDIFANDFEIDLNDTVQVTDIDTSSLKGQLFITPEGGLGYDPNGQFLHLGVGEQATEHFTYTLTDQHGASGTATVEITVTGVNDAPTAVTDEFVGFENVGFYAPIDALLANDFDVDGDHFSFAGLGPAVNGEVTLTPDGFVVFTPSEGYLGDAGFQYAIQDENGALGFGEVDVLVREIMPGDLQYQTVSLFEAQSLAGEATYGDGTTLLDLLVDTGGLAGVGVELGGMPFFSAVLTGAMQGTASVGILPDGTPLAGGNLVGELDLQVELSPIFKPLGGELYDALAAAAPASGPNAHGGAQGFPTPSSLDLGLDELLADLTGFDDGSGNSILDMMDQAMESIDLNGMEALIGGTGFGTANAIAFGDGTFYLDVAGLLSGAITIPDEDGGEAIVGADIFGQFAGAAHIDIRDDLTVVEDGMLDGTFDVAMAPNGADAGLAIGSIVSEEPAMAA